MAGYSVGSAIQFGAFRAISNRAENGMRQTATTGSINPTDVAVAGVTGFTMRFAAPVVVSTTIGDMLRGYVGSVALGTAVNTS